MEQVAQLGVGDEAGEVHDVGHAQELGERLQLAEVRAAAGDHEAHAGHAAAAATAIASMRYWKPFSYWRRPHVTTSGPSAPRAGGRDGRRPQRGVDAVGDLVDLVGRQVERRPAISSTM